MKRSFWQTGLAYVVAGALLWWVAHNVQPHAIAAALDGANIGLFLLARTGEFACLFFGEALLFSMLFAYFHEPIKSGHLLPANAGRFFLQAVNGAVGEGAFALAISRRMGASLLGIGCTVMFMSFIDLQVMVLMAAFGRALAPSFPLRIPWRWIIPIMGAAWLLAAFWITGRPRWRPLEWLYRRPSLVSFRTARPRHYARLMAVRAAIFTAQAIGLYVELRSFGVHATLLQVIAAFPVILFCNGMVTPGGLGPTQAVIVFGFAGLASKADLLAVSLAHSGLGIAMRLTLGIFAPGLLFAPKEDSAEIAVLTAEQSADLR